MLLLATHIVPTETQAIRLSEYVRIAFPDLHSRNAAKKAIKTGAILLDDQPAQTGTWVKPGMELKWYDLLPTPPKPYELDLEVVYEDDHLAIVYKPAGLRVSGPQYRTLLNALPLNLKKSKASDALGWPRPVHRLDSATQGLVLVAKARLTQIRLTQMFEAREINKQYAALVMGTTPSKGTLDMPIDGKEARSTFERLEQVPSIKNEFVSLLRVIPHTGRTHQIRIHLSETGFPILGDPLYSPSGHRMKGKGLFLAATGLTFSHPITGENMTHDIPIPHKFLKRMEREAQMWKRAQAG